MPDPPPTPLRVGIIDQSPVSAGSSPATALRNTIDLAQRADRWGYHRHWLAEHHASSALAGPAPEVLIGAIAEATERIRVGSGGVMLPHYSPLKVAETFRVLDALAPGRIDLGVGRAPGGAPLTTLALDRHHQPPSVDDFPRQVAELIGFLRGAFDPEHPFSKITVSPVPEPGSPGPEVWMLGSSGYGARLAAQLGLPFCSAHFINPGDSVASAELYRSEFDPTDAAPEPACAVGISAVVAETTAEAQRLAASGIVWRERLQRGLPIGPIQSVEDAIAELGPGAEARLARPRQRLLVGDPLEVAAGLRQLAADHQAEEVLVVTLAHDHEARCRSYELLAEALRLT